MVHAVCRHRGGTRICVLTFRSARNRDTREAACIAHFYTVISKHTYLLSPHNFLSISMFIIHSSCISRPSHSSDRTCVYVNPQRCNARGHRVPLCRRGITGDRNKAIRNLSNSRRDIGKRRETSLVGSNDRVGSSEPEPPADCPQERGQGERGGRVQRGTVGGDRDRQKVLTYRQVDARAYIRTRCTIYDDANSIFFFFF